LLPSRLLFELLCETPIGKPDCQVKTAAVVHPPANRLPILLLPIL